MYAYGQAGNLKSKIENGNITTWYFYNAQNKLCRIELDNGDYYEFLYDSQNRRIALSTNGVWRKIIHDGKLPIIETDCTNVIARIFVRGLGIAEGTGDIIAELKSPTVGEPVEPHYYLANHRGDTVLVLNSSGQQECYLRYDAFGLPITDNNPLYTKYLLIFGITYKQKGLAGFVPEKVVLS